MSSFVARAGKQIDKMIDRIKDKLNVRQTYKTIEQTNRILDRMADKLNDRDKLIYIHRQNNR